MGLERASQRPPDAGDGARISSLPPASEPPRASRPPTRRERMTPIPAPAPGFCHVRGHVLRATDFLDNLRDILSSALEAHLAVVSNRLNEIMKRLTSWGAIILVPTLIAGIYGMNFHHIPELRWAFGYPFALGLMLISGALLYRAFNRRGWL